VVAQPGEDEPASALLVDELGGIAQIDPATVETALDGLEPALARHCTGAAPHRGRLALLLDPQSLLSTAALEEVASAQ